MKGQRKQNKQSARRSVQNPRDLVQDLLMTRLQLTRDDFVDAVWGHYQDAVDRRDERWIRDLQRESAEIALSEEEVLRFLPNPFGRNFITAPRRRTESRDATFLQGPCTDVRLQDNPNLTTLRMDAAESTSVTAAAMTGAPAVQRRGPQSSIESNPSPSPATETPMEVDTTRKEGVFGVHPSQLILNKDPKYIVPRLHTTTTGPTVLRVPSRRPSQRESGDGYRHRHRPTERDQDTFSRISAGEVPTIFFYGRKYRLERSPSPRSGDDKQTEDDYSPDVTMSQSAPDIAVTVSGNGRVVRTEPSRKRPRDNYNLKSPPRKRKSCPIRGCGSAMDNLKTHLRQAHIPALFQDGETGAELQNHQFQSLRRHGLEMLARFIFGQKGTVYDLMDLVNEEAQIQDSRIIPETRQAMEALALVSRYRIPRDGFSVQPVNSPAALIHWHSLAFLMVQLSPRQRGEMFQLFGERWTVPEPKITGTTKEKKRRLCRLNPARRRRLQAKKEREERRQEQRKETHSSRQSSGVSRKRVEETLPPRKGSGVSKKEEAQRKLQPTTRLEKPRLGECSYTRRLSPIQEESRTPDRTPAASPSLPEGGARVCLKKGSMEVNLSQVSLKQTTMKGLVLTLDSPLQLDYEGTPSPPKSAQKTSSTKSSPINEEALLRSATPSPTNLQVVDEVGPDPVPMESSEVSTTASQLETTTDSTASSGVNTEQQSYAQAVAVNLPAEDGPRTTIPTYAEICASTSKKSSPVGVVKPRTVKSDSAGRSAFDSHFHLDRLCWRLELDTLEEAVIYRTAEVPPRVPVTITGGVMIFCDPAGFKHVPGSINPKWRLAVGVHPKKIKDLTPPRLQHLQSLLLQPRITAFGEIGLDYGEGLENKEAQLTALEQLLPMCPQQHTLVIHVRGHRNEKFSDRAFRDCLELVKKHIPKSQRIHLHCFTGDHQQRKNWSEAFPNCYFGFTGKVARFQRPQREALQRVPISQLLLETDSPYLSILPGQQFNTPSYIGEVAQLVANIRQEPISQILNNTERNGQRLYPPRVED